MDIELVEIDDRGTGYAVIHRDDQSTYGLHFKGAPIDSPTDLIAFLSEKAIEIEVKETVESIVPRPAPLAVRNLVKQRAPIVRPAQKQE